MANTTPNRPDVYSRITDKIIADLEQGTRTWMRPWNAEHAAGWINRAAGLLDWVQQAA